MFLVLHKLIIKIFSTISNNICFQSCRNSNFARASNSIGLATFLALTLLFTGIFFSSALHAEQLLTPSDFLQLWETDNKRNLLLRYQGKDWQPGLFLYGDFGPKVNVVTDKGNAKGEIDRANLNLNSKHFSFYYDYLFVHDVNAEISYGELVFALTTADWIPYARIDIAAKKNSVPVTTLDANGNEVFKSGTLDSQSNKDISNEFDQKLLHIKLFDVDLSTLLDKQSKLDSLALQTPYLSLGKSNLALLFLNYKENDVTHTPARRETVLKYYYDVAPGKLSAEVGYMQFSDSGDKRISRSGIGYSKIDNNKGSWFANLYRTNDLAEARNYNGYRLGLKIPVKEKNMFYVLKTQKNALSETDSMVIRDINIVTFAMLFPLD